MNIVYKITNLVNGKKYIGVTSQTLKDRWKKHKCDSLRLHTASAIHAAIRKYGASSFEMKELDRHEDRDVALYREIFWIAALNTYRKKYGYNLTHGGDGVIVTDEIRLKMSKARIGKRLSEELKEKLSIIHTGYKQSPDHIAHAAASHIGKKRTPEQRARMSLAQRGKKISLQGLENIRRANALVQERRRERLSTRQFTCELP